MIPNPFTPGPTSHRESWPDVTANALACATCSVESPRSVSTPGPCSLCWDRVGSARLSCSRTSSTTPSRPASCRCGSRCPVAPR